MPDEDHFLARGGEAVIYLGPDNRNVLRQAFIRSDAPVDLADVKKLLAFNGFENTRRNDYYNQELGLILEDIHDENVIVNSETLFFIDTVFYTVSPDKYTPSSKPA